MFNCVTLQHVIQCKCDAESFIYSIRLSEIITSVSYVYTCVYNIVLKLSALSTHARFETCTPPVSK